MAACMSPFIVEQKTERPIPVPCGKCVECLKRRTSGWSFRLMQEEKKAHSAFFLTLTYDTKYVPITPNGFMNLDKRDVQLFMKRLRKAHPKNHPKIKYYAAGEYGTKSFRPHYHLIIFNADLSLFASAWDKGQIHYGTVTGASVGYTLKYLSKPKRIPVHRNDDRLPEFSLMSKGLGASYLTDQMVSWHHSDLDNRMYVQLDDGQKVSMPRYFKDRIYNDQQRERVGFFSRFKALQKSDETEQQLREIHGTDYYKVLVEIDKAKYEKMYRESLKNRSL